MILDETLSRLPYSRLNKAGLANVLGYSGPAIQEFNRDYWDVLHRHGVKTLQELWLPLHRREVEQCLNECTTFEEMGSKLNIQLDMMKKWLKFYGYEMPTSCSNSGRVTIRERVLLDHLWERPPFSSFESYLYGYYLGDGTCSHWKGKPTTMYWIVYNPDDYQNLYRMQEGLGCKNLIVPDKKGLRLIISARKATDRMVERGLLWTGKGWRHPELDLKMLRCFDAMALFRGLVDSDGWLQKERNGRNQLCFCSSWEKLVDSVRELMATSYGVVGHKYTNTNRESAWGDQFIHRVSYSYDECCRLVKLGLYKDIGVGLERKRFIPLSGDLDNDEWL